MRRAEEPRGGELLGSPKGSLEVLSDELGRVGGEKMTSDLCRRKPLVVPVVTAYTRVRAVVLAGVEVLHAALRNQA